jgi:hypothetical protein
VIDTVDFEGSGHYAGGQGEAPHAAPMAMMRGKRARPRRGIYLLPNAFTTAALFCGFYAIVMAMNQRSTTPAGPSSSPWCSTAWTAAWRA